MFWNLYFAGQRRGGSIRHTEVLAQPSNLIPDLQYLDRQLTEGRLRRRYHWYGRKPKAGIVTLETQRFSPLLGIVGLLRIDHTGKSESGSFNFLPEARKKNVRASVYLNLVPSVYDVVDVPPNTALRSKPMPKCWLFQICAGSEKTKPIV
jgi:hypothetical protein